MSEEEQGVPRPPQIDHQAAWGQRVVATTYLDLFLAHGASLTTKRTYVPELGANERAAALSVVLYDAPSTSDVALASAEEGADDGSDDKKKEEKPRHNHKPWRPVHDDKYEGKNVEAIIEGENEGAATEKPNGGVDPDEQSYFGLPLSTLTTLQVRFLGKAKHSVECGFLRDRGVFATEIATNLALVWRRPSSEAASSSSRSEPARFLQRDDVARLLAEVSSTFDRPQTTFEYSSIVWALVQASYEAVSELCPDLFPAEQMPPLTLLQNVPIGGFMIPYDFAFETSPAAHRISFPNYNILSPAHAKYYAETRPNIDPSRLHYYFITRCLAVPPHEVVHIFQGIAKQRDTSNYKCSAEWDARYLEYSLFYYLGSQEPPLQASPGSARQAAFDMLSNGVMEAALMTAVVHDTRVRGASRHDIREAVKLKRSFGTYDAKYEGKPIYDSVFAFHDSPRDLKRMIEVIFKDRFDVDTYRAPPPQVDPDLMRPSPWITENPASLEEIDAFLLGESM